MLSEPRVILVGNFSPDGQESMLRFAELLRSELSARSIQTTIIRPKARAVRFAGSTPTALRKWLGYIDKYVIFPVELRREVGGLCSLKQLEISSGCSSGLRRRVVVHICDHSNAPYVRLLRGVPHVVTVHDLLAIRSAQGEFADNPTRWSGRMLQSMILDGLRRCALAACISEATQLDLYRLTGRTSANTTVIPNGLNYPYSPLSPTHILPALDQIFVRLGTSRPQRYILHVGGNDWYKNRRGVLRTFSALKERGPNLRVALVMAGTPPSLDLVEMCSELGITPQVYWIGKVSNAELHALYSGAEALLFPSLAEGFGWPLIEAQACGCPVVTSSRAPMTEVVAGGALLFNPEDPVSGAICLERLLSGGSRECERLRELGLVNVRRFSTERMIDGYLELYNRAAGSRVQLPERCDAKS